MNVKLAASHRQPRHNKPEPCDHHTGMALEANPNNQMVFCPDVKLYNIFMPGIGTDSFHLCPLAVEVLSDDS